MFKGKKHKNSFKLINKLVIIIFSTLFFNNKLYSEQILPLKSVLVEITLAADAYDIIPKNDDRNDTNFYSNTEVYFKTTLIDRNLSFWDSLISQTQFQKIGDISEIGNCLCVCNSAKIILTDSKNEKYEIYYDDCGYKDLLVKSKKKLFALKLSELNFNKMENRIKNAFKHSLKKIEP